MLKLIFTAKSIVQPDHSNWAQLLALIYLKNTSNLNLFVFGVRL